MKIKLYLRLSGNPKTVKNEVLKKALAAYSRLCRGVTVFNIQNYSKGFVKLLLSENAFFRPGIPLPKFKQISTVGAGLYFCLAAEGGRSGSESVFLSYNKKLTLTFFMKKVMNKIELEQAISGKISRTIAENTEGGALLRKRLRAVKICLKIAVNEHSLKFLMRYFKEYSVDNKDYGVPYEVYKYLENRLELANQEQV